MGMLDTIDIEQTGYAAAPMVEAAPDALLNRYGDIIWRIQQAICPPWGWPHKVCPPNAVVVWMALNRPADHPVWGGKKPLTMYDLIFLAQVRVGTRQLPPYAQIYTWADAIAGADYVLTMTGRIPPPSKSETNRKQIVFQYVQDHRQETADLVHHYLPRNKGGGMGDREVVIRLTGIYTPPKL